jgi:hypothetical protein
MLTRVQNQNGKEHNSRSAQSTEQNKRLFDSASSLKQRSPGRHVTPLGTHYSDFERTSFALSPCDGCFVEKQHIPIL